MTSTARPLLLEDQVVLVDLAAECHRYVVADALAERCLRGEFAADARTLERAAAEVEDALSRVCDHRDLLIRVVRDTGADGMEQILLGNGDGRFSADELGRLRERFTADGDIVTTLVNALTALPETVAARVERLRRGLEDLLDGDDGAAVTLARWDACSLCPVVALPGAMVGGPLGMAAGGAYCIAACWPG
jgi:hypothetical protein